jgi:hypothetical protein
MHDNVMAMGLKLDNFSVEVTFVSSININKSQLESIIKYSIEQRIKLQFHNCHKMAQNKGLF